MIYWHMSSYARNNSTTVVSFNTSLVVDFDAQFPFMVDVVIAIDYIYSMFYENFDEKLEGWKTLHSCIASP